MVVRVAIAGAGGRMGRMLLDAAAADAGIEVTGQLAGRGADMDRALANADILIDFTRPEGTLDMLAACRTRGVRMVIGTTGFSAEQKAHIDAAAKDIAIVFSANMSLGMNVLATLVETAARALHKQYDIEVVEAHHKRKVDAPSGSALMLGEAAAGAMGKALAEIGVFERHGVIGERTPGSIGFSTIRGGDIVGEHTVMFAGPGEVVELSHRAGSRATFAQGAMAAAHFLSGKPAGLYDMRDVLGLR